MGQVLHGCATTTETVRRAIQGSQESLRALSKRYGVNQEKTLHKWKQRRSTADLPTGPRQPRSTILREDEASIEAFRRHARRVGCVVPHRRGWITRPLRLRPGSVISNPQSRLMPTSCCLDLCGAKTSPACHTGPPRHHRPSAPPCSCSRPRIVWSRRPDVARKRLSRKLMVSATA